MFGYHQSRQYIAALAEALGTRQVSEACSRWKAGIGFRVYLTGRVYLNTDPDGPPVPPETYIGLAEYLARYEFALDAVTIRHVALAQS